MSRLKRLPTSVAGRPLSFFAVFLLGICGLVVAFGIAEPNELRAALDPDILLQLWGGLLAITNAALFIGMLDPKRIALEKLGLQSLSLLALLYAVWVLIAVGLGSGLMTIVLCLVLMSFCETRIAVIRGLIRPWEPPE